MKKTAWRIRVDNTGSEFICQHWCPRLADAENVWNYQATPKGPHAMREHLQRPEYKDGHYGRSRLRECPTCITAVLDVDGDPSDDCGPIFVSADREELIQELLKNPEVTLPVAAQSGVEDE